MLRYSHPLCNASTQNENVFGNFRLPQQSPLSDCEKNGRIDDAHPHNYLSIPKIRCRSVQYFLTQLVSKGTVTMKMKDSNTVVTYALPSFTMDSCQKAIKLALIVYFGKFLGEDFVTKLSVLTSLYWLHNKNYFAKCLILNIVYTLCCPTIETIK